VVVVIANPEINPQQLWISFAVVGVPIGAILLGLLFGGLPAFQHFVLRLFLFSSTNLPVNCARFLDYCASIQILRKVGGGYIFVHRYLLEYFAELEA
jgi:hypothetical protein